MASRPAAAPATQQTHSAWRRVDAAQEVIDAYRDRFPTDGLDEPPLKVPRLSALLPLLGVLALLAAAVVLILVIFKTEAPARAPQAEAPDAPAAAPAAPQPERPTAVADEDVDQVVALPLPEEGPEAQADPATGDGAAVEPAAEQAADGADQAAADPRPKAVVKKKPKRIKKRTKRRRRRTRRRRSSR